MSPYEYGLFVKNILDIILVYNNIRQNAVTLQILRRRRQLLKNIFLQVQTSRNKLMSAVQTVILTPDLVNLNVKVSKSIWMKNRSQHFWHEVVLATYDDAEWMETFRMKKQIYLDLCSILRNKLEPKQLLLKSREPVSVEKQVAVALYKLASCTEYRVIGNVFGIHKATVRKCLYRVVNAINEVMLPVYLRMPTEAEAMEIAQNFENLSHIPQIIGCIDSSHIPILAPTDGYRDFVNRQGWPSYNLQAVVDDKCRFRNICIRHPGNTHDAAVLKDSSLFKTAHTIIPQITRNIEDVEVPYMLIGDPAYPLLPWLMKGYPGSVNAEAESFNVHLNSARVTVEMAFGRLRGRWRILLQRIDVHYEFVPKITSACCILQNFLEYKNEQFIRQWLDDVVEAEMIFPQPSHFVHRERDNLSGSNLRNHLCNYLAQNYPLRKSYIS